MNATDALFWEMDKLPDLRSTIGALMILEHLPSREHMRHAFERISWQLLRMRQRVQEVPFGLAAPEWVEDRHFDLEYHLRYVGVPAPSDMDELLDELSPLYATALDVERPLWEAYVAEGLTGGRGAVLVKMHHCLTDGVGGARMSEALLRREEDEEPVRVPADSRATTPGALLWRAARDDVEEGYEVGRAAVLGLADAALDPIGTVRHLARGWRSLRGFTRELFVRRARSPLQQRRSLSRRLATFEMSLADIDRAREWLRATNNDFVLTVVAGAMHRWHTSRGSDVRSLRVLVPVSLRDPDDMSLGNSLALLAVTLPVHEPNPVRRLRLIQRAMGQVKGDRRARVYPLLARVMASLPRTLTELIARQQTTRANFVCTNVPGPRQPCYLAGAPVEKLYPYAPLVGDHPIAIALYSYRDTLHVGLDVDPLAMDDLPHFCDALRESYNELLRVGSGSAKPPVRADHRRRRARRTPSAA